MVHTRLAALHVPSVRQELRHRQRHDAPIAIVAHSVAVPYPVGAATLQITGVHLRLMEVVEAAAQAAATAKLTARPAAAAAAPASSSSSSAAGTAGRGFQFFGGAQAEASRTSSAAAARPAKKEAKTPAPAVTEPKRAKGSVEKVAETTDAHAGAALAVNVVVRVQTQPAGAAAAATEKGAAHHTREFIAAIVPMQIGGGGSDAQGTRTSQTTGSAAASRAHTADAHGENAKSFPAPFRPVKKGPRPPKGTAAAGGPGQTAVSPAVPARPVFEAAAVSGCEFVKLDLRLQVERVRFIVEVWPGIPTVASTGAAGGAVDKSSPYRRRPRADGDEEAAHAPMDAALEVVVVGAVSPLA